MAANKKVILREKPIGQLKESHFGLQSAVMPSPKDGEVLVRNILLSLDAANRAWIEGPTYKPAVKLGEVMHGYAIGEVVESRSSTFFSGDLVLGELGWQEFVTLDANTLLPCIDHRPVSHLHSLLGVAGKTAYHGLLSTVDIKEAETLVVSAAAGSVGSFVGQIGKIKGAQVIGIAGGPEKCAWVCEELGFDDCIDYKNSDVPSRILELCPSGVDVYFDNVGGEILQAMLFAMNVHGRIACCGAVSQYDGGTNESPSGLPGLLVFKRLSMQGFLVSDFAAQNDVAERDLKAWNLSGRLKVIEEIIEGIEQAPRGLIGLLAGENRGKRMIRISPDPA